MRDYEEGTGRKCYTVSEAVQRCGVPSHVLRYWEDELGLLIERTAQGHRVYSEEDLAVFEKVKELKEKGIQLKAIRLLLEDSEEGRWLGKLLGEEMTGDKGLGADEGHEEENSGTDEGYDRKNSGADEGCDGKSYGANKECGEESLGANEQEGECIGSDEAEWEEADYEIIPATEADNYRRFEEMLRCLIGEVVAEQNERLERTLSERIHEEMEDLYIQLQQEEARREAASAGERRGYRVPKEGILRRIRRILNS
ncbi:MAG: helix-turn-helix domain-containing protein [Lachnospiraceae bacterium]|nr:helix-turn-helix domain-containing protein [Lachnospiraceae bacterium]